MPLPIIVSAGKFSAGMHNIIFRKVWLNVGCEEDLPQPGDYFAKDLAVGKPRC